ncbi:MAG: hypothetical protein IJE43_08825 [Alphaproteobacteria bacterium]|nr:hypothetical protein [Alphaproteobacteria bacterium]
MFTFLFIVGACASAVGVACALDDGKCHASELEEFESKHPYTNWELTQPYNP